MAARFVRTPHAIPRSPQPSQPITPDMTRLLLLCPLVGLAACASGLPPAPTAAPMSAAVHDSLVPVVDLDALTHESSAADAAVLNDLADAAPDDVGRARVRRERRPLGHRRPHLRHASAGPLLPRLLPGPGPQRDGDLPQPGRALRADDPRPLPGRGPARRPGLPGADRERLLERGGEPGLRRRDVAVHARHREGLRPPGGLLGGRAPRSGQGHRRRRPAPARPARAVRLALSGRRRLQRRGRQGLAQPRQARVGHARRARRRRSPPTGRGRLGRRCARTAADPTQTPNRPTRRTPPISPTADSSPATTPAPTARGRGSTPSRGRRRRRKSRTSPATPPSSGWPRTTCWPPRPRTTCRSSSPPR